MVVGMNLGFLSPTQNWVTYDVENPARRLDVLNLALADIRNHALPFFDHFKDPIGLAQQLTRAQHPGFFREGAAVWFVAWQLGHAAAERCR